MTFWQDNYYPYYKVSSKRHDDTITVDESENQLRRIAAHLESPDTYPAALRTAAQFGSPDDPAGHRLTAAIAYAKAGLL